MLSGNGRHRRPRQAPALIVAAGVAGSAIAIPLLGATSASAADTATWDKLAECESGGSWSADAGNGYYGGLQFSQQVWEEYGGLDFAPSADLASRSQQISVAEKVLDDQGTDAWPSCAPIAGLTEDGAAADVDPGAPITTIPSDPSEEPTDSTEPEKNDGESTEPGEPSASPSESADPSDSTKSSEKPDAEADGDDEARDKNHDESGKPDDSADSGDTTDPSDSPESPDSDKSGQDDATSPTPTPSAGEGEGRHRGDSADDKPSDGSSREGSGRHASRGDERQRDGADGTYTVRSGDSLWGIADDLDVKGGWAELYEENEKSVGSDPDLILPGQSLDLGEK